MSKTYKGVGGIDLPNENFPAKITKGYYRVKEENADGAAELGAYRLLANAIKTCDENPGSVVVADAGVCIYPDDGTATGNPVEETPTAGDTTGEDTTGGEPAGSDDNDPTGEQGDGNPTGDDTPAGGDDVGQTDDPGQAETPKDDVPDTPTKPTAPGSVVGYAKLKTLMNVRTAPSSDADLVKTCKEDSIVAVTEFCENGWMRILCEESESAYILNTDGKYASTGKSLYTVKKDDNLWKIAETELGDGSRYKEISDINFLVSNRIKVGMSLILPEVIPTAEEA